MANEVLVYEPAPPHKDVTEHLEAGLATNQLVKVDWRAEVAKMIGEKGRSPMRVLTPREVLDLPSLNGDSEVLGTLVRIPHLALIGAETGAGKSTMLMQMASVIGRGTEFLGWKCKRPRRVLICDLEQGSRSLQRLIEQFGLADATNVGILHEPDGLQLDKDPAQRREIESILAEGWDAVFIDPAYAMWGGDMSDARAILEVFGWWGEWRRRYQFAQFVPGHIRKPPAGAAFTINEIFGSKAATWRAESVLGLRRLNNGAAELHWFKDREGDIAPVGSHWRLLFNGEIGFYRDHREQIAKTSTRVTELLREHPDQTLDQIYLTLGRDISSKTIRAALTEIKAVHDGGKRVADRRWSLHPSLIP